MNHRFSRLYPVRLALFSDSNGLGRPNKDSTLAPMPLKTQ